MENKNLERFHRPPLTPSAEMLTVLDQRTTLEPQSNKAQMIKTLFEAAPTVHLMADNPELEAETEATWAEMVKARTGANNNTHFAQAA